MDNHAIGKRIEEAREASGITKKELAERIQVAASTITRYEKGDINKIKMPIIEAIANVLSVNPMWIIGKSEYKKIKEMTKSWSDTPLPPLTPKDEREIARDLEKMLSALDDKNGMAAMGGTVEDQEDRELLKSSLLTSMRLAKQIAKKKFTPKKYRKE